MGSELFEVVPYSPNARARKSVMFPRVWDAGTIAKCVPWLRHQNWKGRNIYSRPKGEHDLSMVDDLTALGEDEGHQRSLTLYMRYQSTNERAFSQCMSDLLKLRAEKRKQQIGFESQKLAQAEHARKQGIESQARRTQIRRFTRRSQGENTRNYSITGSKPRNAEFPTASSGSKTAQDA